MENAKNLLEKGSKAIGLLESRLLLSFILKRTPAQILAFGEDYFLNEREFSFWENALARRKQGEPFFYIIGEVFFDDLVFKVSPAVLIPRPETEILLFKAIDFIQQNNIQTLLDLGTGSGILAVSLKKRFSHLRVWASDVSIEALNIAQENALKNQVEISFLKSNWFSHINTRFDCILSNPPYVAEDDPHLKDLQFEPQHALVAKEKGRADLRWIIQKAPFYLNPNGALFLEHGHDQGDFCQRILLQNGFQEVFTQNDCADLPRISGGVLR